VTKKEIINRNIGLSFDLLKKINNDLSIIKKIPKGSVIEFVEKDFPKKEKQTSGKKRRKYISVKNEFEVI
jgi:hypothetical protein